MKRDRRLELLIDLLNGDWVSRELLADKYSVTKKTISRDVEYLNSIGIPIQSKSGVSGGFKLEDSFKSNHLMNETEQQKEVLKELIGPDRLAEEGLHEHARLVSVVVRLGFFADTAHMTPMPRRSSPAAQKCALKEVE